jgi:hypothetical protein
MNQLVVTIIIILLPGIVATVICDKITVHSTWSPFKFSLYAFVLGVFSYAGLQFGYFSYDVVKACSLDNANWTYLDVWANAISEKPTIPAKEVIMAVCLSLPVSFFTAFLINHKIFNKFAQKIKVTTKYGDENLYSYYLNAEEIDWVYVRDIDKNITYQGRVVSYSENEHIQELVLSEVSVYRYEDSAPLYSVPTIYLCKEMGSFIIEAIPQELLGFENGKETTN